MSTPVRAMATAVLIAVLVTGSFFVGYQAGGRSGVLTPLLSPTATEVGKGEFQQQFELFWEAWRLVDQEYYDRQAINYQKMTYGAIQGMLEALGDPHTFFSTPDHARLSQEELQGKFEGVGVMVEMKDSRLTVVAPLDGSPGARAGIRPGDVIIAVDGQDISQWTMLEAISRIRGPRGTKVQLTIVRQGEKEPLVVEIVRDVIPLVSVRARTLDNGIGYVKVASFSVPTAEELRRSLASLLLHRPKGLVLDLRNNPGGLLDSAVEVASQFLKDGVVLYERRADGEDLAFNAIKGGLATDVPLVVLVNQGSASASEIVAGALQDQGRAIIIGEQTFGKDTVQNVHQLSDESTLRVTIARWYTPNRQEIHEKGLTPDVVVEMTEEDVQAGRDPQLAAAVERLLAASQEEGNRAAGQ